MKKRINSLMILSFIGIFGFFAFSNSVKAQLYNGQGGEALSKGSGYASCGSTINCLYNNKDILLFKISLWYVDNGSFSQGEGWRDFYYTNEKGHNYLNNLYSNVYYFSELDNCKAGDYQCASNKIRAYYGETGDTIEVTDGAKKDINWMVNSSKSQDTSDFYKDILTKESELASSTSAATKGYRIYIEPAFNVKNVKFSSNDTASLAGILTVKELAKTYNGTSCKGAPNITSGCSSPLLGNKSLAQVLNIQFTDTGISSPKACTSITQDELKDSKNGCGYNIVDISNYVTGPPCYSSSVETTQSLACINTDQNNIGKYTEKYEEKSCDNATEEEQTNTEYGKLIATDSNSCKIYCIESAIASFPGNISRAVALDRIPNKGTYFAWPTRLNDPNGRYSMKITNKLTCTVVRENDNCNTETLINSASSVAASAQAGAKLTAGTNKKLDESLVVDFERKTSKTDVGDFDGKVGKNKVVFTKETYFKIRSNANRYFNKNTNAVTDSGSVSSIIVDRGEGVVSLSLNDSTKQKYNLTLSDIKIGVNNKFGSKISDYTCNYRIADSSCVCPEGTLRAGDSLYDKLTEGKTCVELQRTECNLCKCPPDSAKAYEDYVLGEGLDSKACKAKQEEKCYNYCGEDNPTFKTCTDEYIEKGYTEKQAKKICEVEACPRYFCTDSTGKSHVEDFEQCMSLGNSYKSCYILYCSDDICIDDICTVCTEDCKWKLQSSNVTNTTKISYVKTCSDGGICDKIELSCPGGETNMNNPLPCVQSQLGVSNITEALNNGTINAGDVDRAFNACKETVCPGSNQKIIYRVIDLNNPFPGKSNKGLVSGFSNGGRGRKPGSNWDSEEIVKNKILNAREAKGYELYNKEPLYVITLTPSDIKNIRKYNKNNKYSNFDMNCTNESKTSKCISNYIHKTYSKILTGGKCNNISNEQEFDSCYNGK
ncbi:MAG: hypothetical protein J6K21_00205 [Bacilli bacterium]|nr:hypothetical protein [Bacilli bacterium]